MTYLERVTAHEGTFHLHVATIGRKKEFIDFDREAALEIAGQAPEGGLIMYTHPDDVTRMCIDLGWIKGE